GPVTFGPARIHVKKRAIERIVADQSSTEDAGRRYGTHPWNGSTPSSTIRMEDLIAMVIRYADGTILEGLLLSQDNQTLRAAVRGVNDAMVFHNEQGAWIAESEEPVEIKLEWQLGRRRVMPQRTDCVYSQELAERLVQLLRANQTLWRHPEAFSRPSL